MLLRCDEFLSLAGHFRQRLQLHVVCPLRILV
jgi:hypothetical protein